MRNPQEPSSRWLLLAGLLFHLAAGAATILPVHQSVDRFGYSAIVDRWNNVYRVAGKSSLVKLNEAGRRMWVTRLPEGAFVQALTVDDSQNVVVAGHKTFDGQKNGFLAMYSKEGRSRWVVDFTFGTGTNSAVFAGGFDRSGIHYCRGTFFNATNEFGDSKVFAAGVSPAGIVRWIADALPLAGRSTAMAVNPLGGIALTDFETVCSVSGAGEQAWVAVPEQNAQGPESSTFRIADDDFSASPIQYDGSGNLFVAGTFWRRDGTRYGRWNPAVQKLDSTGSAVWTSSGTGPNERIDESWSMKVNDEGFVYLGWDGGIECQLVTDDDDGSYYACETRPTLAKIDPEGQLAWVTRFAHGEEFSSELGGIDVDNEGRCVISTRLVGQNVGFDVLSVKHVFLGMCDRDGIQNWSGKFSYLRHGINIFASPPSFDRHGDVRVAPSMVKDGIENAGVLRLRFQPWIHPLSPKIVQPPEGINASIGQSIMLSVSARGKGRLRYQWRLNGRNIPGANAPALPLTSLRPDQAGNYSVEVRNGLGQVVTPEASVVVNP